MSKAIEFTGDGMVSEGKKPERVKIFDENSELLWSGTLDEFVGHLREHFREIASI